MPIPVPVPVPVPAPMPVPVPAPVPAPFPVPFGKRSIENVTVLNQTESTCTLWNKSSKLNCTG